MDEFRVVAGEDGYELEARVLAVGRDLLVVISGGELPHVGAVSIAQPRPSLRDPSKTSATASVFCLLGHKEDGIAKATAEILAARLDTNVVVTAGAHWQDLTSDGIAAVLKNASRLVDKILAKLGRHPNL